MEESILFNRGNSIASGYDFNEVYRAAEIKHTKAPQNERFIMVKDPKDDQFLAFYLKDQESKKTSTTIEYLLQDKKN